MGNPVSTFRSLLPFFWFTEVKCIPVIIKPHCYIITSGERRTARHRSMLTRQLQIPLCRPVCVCVCVCLVREPLHPLAPFRTQSECAKRALGVLITTEPGMSLILPMRQLHTSTGLGDGGENLCLILIPFSFSTKKKKTKKKQKETPATDTVTQQCNGFPLQENRLQSKHTATVVEEGRRQHKKSYKQPTDTLTMLTIGWVGLVLEGVVMLYSLNGILISPVAPRQATHYHTFAVRGPGKWGYLHLLSTALSLLRSTQK